MLRQAAVGSPQWGNPRWLCRSLSQEAHCRLLPEAVQGLSPTVSAVSRDWHSTFPHSNGWFQNEHDKRILAFHSHVMDLHISGRFRGKYRFYLYSDYSHILYLFIYLICSQIFSHDFCRARCSSLICGWHIQQRSSEMVQISLAFWRPLRPCFSDIIPRKADLLKTMEILSSVLTWS